MVAQNLLRTPPTVFSLAGVLRTDFPLLTIHNQTGEQKWQSRRRSAFSNQTQAHRDPLTQTGFFER